MSSSWNRLAHFVLLVIATLVTYSQAQIESVTIGSDNHPHTCVNDCLFGSWYGINKALGCAQPVANQCYCRTDTPAASAVNSHVSSCITKSCGSGDVPQDLPALKSLYASYCMGAGYTAPIIKDWFVPAVTTTAEDDAATSQTNSPGSRVTSSVPTTTQLTIVTQTAGSSATSSVRRVTQVTIQATSTRIVRPISDSINVGLEPSQLKSLAIGLGVGVPVLLIALGAGLCTCLRRRRRRRAAASAYLPPTPPPPASEMSYQPTPLTSPTPSRAAMVSRKPVASKVVENVSPIEEESGARELAGGYGVRREVDGREVHPFPDRVGSPPVVVPGQWEADGRQVAGHQQGRRGQRWELP